MGYLRTTLLLATLTALFMGIGALIGGQVGMLIALVFAGALNFWSYWNSDKVVLRMHHARPITEKEDPHLHQMIADLARQAALPMPKIYVIDTPQPNAFATGRNPENAAVAATTGLLQQLSDEEVAGVMAHELAHIKNHDTLIMSITATLAGAISMLANFAFLFGGQRNEEGGGGGIGGVIGTVALLILAPLAAFLVQMAISRTREYAADRMGAQICGNPRGLASALARIESAARRIPNPDAEHNPATAHLFVINPLSGARMDNLFSTHPNTAHRIAALESLAQEGKFSSSLQKEKASLPRRRKGPWG